MITNLIMNVADSLSILEFKDCSVGIIESLETFEYEILIYCVVTWQL